MNESWNPNPIARVPERIALRDYLTITAENSAAILRAPSPAFNVMADIDQLMRAITGEWVSAGFMSLDIARSNTYC